MMRSRKLCMLMREHADKIRTWIETTDDGRKWIANKRGKERRWDDVRARATEGAIEGAVGDAALAGPKEVKVPRVRSTKTRKVNYYESSLSSSDSQSESTRDYISDDYQGSDRESVDDGLSDDEHDSDDLTGQMSYAHYYLTQSTGEEASIVPIDDDEDEYMGSDQDGEWDDSDRESTPSSMGSQGEPEPEDDIEMAEVVADGARFAMEE